MGAGRRASPRGPQQGRRVPVRAGNAAAAAGLAASELAWRLDTAAVSLAAGRDLPHTHLHRDPRGQREPRSEWGLVVSSPAVARAMLREMGALARQIAPQGAKFALAPGAHGTPESRRQLNAACQWLWILSTSTEAAQRGEPVPASDAELLRAIPVNVPPPRRLPGASDSVAGLCEGVISSAERVRHAEWAAARQPGWSPGLTADSLRQVAATSAVISHNCEILLGSLAARIGDNSGLGVCLLEAAEAAEAAGRARNGWVQVAHALDRVTTDTRGLPSQAAAESGDLALWTGRLAYADPQWGLASGPASERRSPGSLAPGRASIPPAVSAVHHACDTLAGLARAEREQVRAAGAARRILVPTRSLPERIDIPRPFAPALPDRVRRPDLPL